MCVTIVGWCVCQVLLLLRALKRKIGCTGGDACSSTTYRVLHPVGMCTSLVPNTRKHVHGSWRFQKTENRPQKRMYLVCLYVPRGIYSYIILTYECIVPLIWARGATYVPRTAHKKMPWWDVPIRFDIGDIRKDHPAGIITQFEPATYIPWYVQVTRTRKEIMISRVCT